MKAFLKKNKPLNKKEYLNYTKSEIKGHDEIDTSIMIDERDNHPNYQEYLGRGQKLSTIKKYLLQYYLEKET